MLNRRIFLGSAVAALGTASGCASHRPGPKGGPSTGAIRADEHEQTLRALQPPKRSRPLVAVAVEPKGSEVTDALVPFGVLSESGLADVVLVSERPDPVPLFPALTVHPQGTWQAFDRRHPEGADYVIVPASHRWDAPALLKWIQGQASKGARIVGVCAGAVTVAAAGLLDGRMGTTHWYERKRLQRQAAHMRWVSDRRYVVDGSVVTTTGVTASVPVSMAMVEAMGGREAAGELAARLGVQDWAAAHDSDRFGLSPGALLTALSSRAAVWNQHQVGIPASDGVHEVSLALAVDAWARTDRAHPVPVGAAPEATTRNGLRLKVETGKTERLTMLPKPRSEQPVQELDRTLERIEDMYGPKVAAWVALQLEYSRSD